MNRLVIGTANFGQKYGLEKIQVSSKEIKKILNYAWKKIFDILIRQIFMERLKS